ncbi:MAG TPA: helix-turn-helix domain-containing protein [Anaerolineae bacterium]|nr:helix-turn-helix domain-containing protein [Anaerolineae bacterium]
MNARARTVLVAFTTVCLLLFPAVSFDNTRRLAETLTQPGLLPYAFAGAVELGVIGLAVGVIVRRRAGRSATGFVATMVGVLTLSVTANSIVGAETFNSARQVLAQVRAWSLWWLLPLAFSAMVPVLVFAFSELLAVLLVEDAQAPQGRVQVRTASELRARIIELYAERPDLPAAEVARLLGCSESTARRARAAGGAGGRERERACSALRRCSCRCR